MTACTMLFERLNTYVDGELAPAEELDVRRHLDVCEACRHTVGSLLGLKDAVAASAEVRPVPHTLRERLGTLGARRRRASTPPLLALVGLAAAVALAVGIARWAGRPAPPIAEGVTEALVADHLHYLQVPDAIEIASSDPEHIAAWFGDKVAFPVRVPRLRSATLLGARLCSLWGHKVALTFYETRGKRVSLFVADPTTFPSTARSGGGCAPALGDYRVCLIPAAPAVLAMVADTEQTAAVLPELERMAGGPQ
jgi:anti-sigma factor RsiW